MFCQVIDVQSFSSLVENRIIRMYYDEHNPPHIHVEYQGNKALIDFQGNTLKGIQFDDGVEAFRYEASGAHFGKICIQM